MNLPTDCSNDAFAPDPKAANEGERLDRAIAEAEIGGDLGQVDHLGDVLLLEHLSADRGDRDRHVAKILGTLAGGDDDVLWPGLRLRRLGRRAVGLRRRLRQGRRGKSKT
jgi:hypothetical protein